MIWNISRKEMKLVMKEKGTFFWLILLPIAFILLFASIFGNVGSSSISVQYLDLDHSAASKQLVQSLGKIDGFTLKTDTSKTKAMQIQAIKDGKQNALLVIPQGFGASLSSQGAAARLELMQDAASSSEVAPIKAVLQNVIERYREGKISKALADKGMKSNQVKQVLQSPIHVVNMKENAAKSNAISQVVPGYTVMFVFFVIITMVRRFIKDKESGMLSRLRSTPMKAYEYLIGMWIPNIFIVLIQCAVLLGFGRLAYHLQLGDLLSIACIIIALSICTTGIGLALSMLVRSENQGVAFTQLITMGGAALGGLWVPFYLLPKFAQTIGHITPQYWAQQGFQKVMLHGAHLGSILPMLLVLLAFGAAGLIIAVLRFKRFMLSAAS